MFLDPVVLANPLARLRAVGPAGLAASEFPPAVLDVLVRGGWVEVRDGIVSATLAGWRATEFPGTEVVLG